MKIVNQKKRIKRKKRDRIKGKSVIKEAPNKEIKNSKRVTKYTKYDIIKANL
jgi:hypothetical protein